MQQHGRHSPATPLIEQAGCPCAAPDTRVSSILISALLPALVGRWAGARAVSRVHEILGLQIQAGPSPAQPAGSASTSTRAEYTFYTTTTTTTALLADGHLLLPVVLHNLIILIRYRLVMENPRCLASGEQRPSIRLSEKSLNWLKLNQTLKYCSGIIKSSQSYLM